MVVYIPLLLFITEMKHKTVEKPKHKTAASVQKQQLCNQCLIQIFIIAVRAQEY